MIKRLLAPERENQTTAVKIYSSEFDMKQIILIAIFLGFAVNSFLGQVSPPPPPPSPAYSPESWKEFTYQADNLKIRFPAEPQIEIQREKTQAGTIIIHNYKYQSFLSLNLVVTEFPSLINFEELMPMKETLSKMREDGLAQLKEYNPKVIKESDLTIDGHSARFMQVETSRGDVTRIKYFVVKNRMYYLFATVKKGDRHGFNFENDFEKLAMAFLDSIKLTAPKVIAETF